MANPSDRDRIARTIQAIYKAPAQFMGTVGVDTAAVRGRVAYAVRIETKTVYAWLWHASPTPTSNTTETLVIAAEPPASERATRTGRAKTGLFDPAN